VIGAMIKKYARLYPGRMVLVSLLITIVVGALLLSLPIAREQDIPLSDLLFTTTSVTCVCGLLTVPLSSFTVFGKLIILALMQIGGLGLMTLTLTFISLVVDMGLSTQTMAGQLLEIESLHDIKRVLWFIVALIFGVELIGTIILFFIGPPHFIEGHRFLSALFYAISSFCNAGFSLESSGLVEHKTNMLTMITIGSMMTIGGVGFMTWYELMSSGLATIKGQRRHRISLHSKIALVMSTLIVIIATVLFWALERNYSLSNLSSQACWGNAFFNAIALRSTGFSTMLINTMQTATIFLIMALAFIGTAPGSVGSGIKVTVFAIFLATVRAIIIGRTAVIIWGRSIPLIQVYKALSIITLSFFWIGIITFCLLICEPRLPFLAIFFESVSAFANLGVSFGITSQLSLIGKLCICLSMIVGRIGSLTLVLAIAQARKVKEVAYPEERVILS
jgi:trk system potassium uptake protein